MTQRVSRPITLAEEEAILDYARQALRKAELSPAEARRLTEQSKDLFRELPDRIQHYREPYISTTHDRIPEFLGRKMELLVCRNSGLVVVEWYEAFNRSRPAWQESLPPSGTEERCHVRAVWVGHHVGSREILDRVLARRGFQLADFWELAACAKRAKSLGRLHQMIWLKGANDLWFRKIKWVRGRPVLITSQDREDLGGLYLVRVS